MSQKIYIAYDDTNIRNIIKLFLINDGFVIEAIENGDLLYKQFIQSKPDIVILDIMMKVTSIDNISTKKIKQIEVWLNNYPKTMFDYKSSNMLLLEI